MRVVGIPGGSSGASIEDYYLTQMGILLGWRLASNDILPLSVGDWLSSNLSTSSRGRYGIPEDELIQFLEIENNDIPALSVGTLLCDVGGGCPSFLPFNDPTKN